MSKIAVALVGLLTAAAPGYAQGLFPFDPRFKLMANGLLTLNSTSFTDSVAFTQFGEAGSVQTNYSSGRLLGFDAGLQVKISKRISAIVSVSIAVRDTTADYAGSFPHPLYLNMPRVTSGSMSGLSHKETVEHISLAYTRTFNDLDLALFGGVSLFEVNAELLTSIVKTEKYPYDTVTISSVLTNPVSDSPVGFHVGAGLDYRLGRFGLGAQLRYSHATATFHPFLTDTVNVGAGGLQLGAGARISF